MTIEYQYEHNERLRRHNVVAREQDGEYRVLCTAANEAWAKRIAHALDTADLVDDEDSERPPLPGAQG